MIQKKVCMLGAFAVGKTSLVRRFVKSIFSEKYLTTVGVKIDKKVVSVAGETMTLMLWDLAGEDDFYKVQMSYLRGASGYLAIVDGTRQETLQTALDLLAKAETVYGKRPFLLLVNKSDLADQWEIKADKTDPLLESGHTLFETSAKNGQNVEAAFLSLAAKMLEN